jgi:hypothetical protein
MRVTDIILESTQIDEAPAGLIGQGLKRVGAKLAGAVGMKGAAASLTGKADTGKEANQLMVDLKGYLGRTGGNIKQVDAGDLVGFLQQKGYPTTAIQGKSGILTTQQVDQALLKTVQAKAKAGGATAGTSAAGSSAGGATGSDTAPAKPAGIVDKFKAGFAAGTGKAAQEPAAGSASDAAQSAASQGVPLQLIKKITQLSTQEKKQLMGML